MLFLLTIILLTFLDGILLFYLVNSEYFSPTSFTGDIEVWNVFLFVVLLSSLFGLVVTVVVFLVEKFISCGWKEFPKSYRAVRYGIMFSVVACVLMLLHVFHFLNFFVGLVLFALLVIGIMLLA